MYVSPRDAVERGRSMQGFLLALQFFTIVPIQQQFDLHTKNATIMYSCLPLIGLLIGLLDVAYLQAMSYTSFSPLFITIIFIFIHAVYTGGLHMDGFVDMSDAFFSYRDRQKRLEILDDPRVGAFGAMGLVAIVLLQLAVVYELILQQQWLMLIAVPVLARIGAAYCFMYMPLAKEKGIAAFFRKLVKKRALTIVLIAFTIASSAFLAAQHITLLVVPLVFFTATMLYRQFCIRNFGGISGDLIGAYITAMEVLLWFSVLLCI